jgi:hypothetical protein
VSGPSSLVVTDKRSPSPELSAREIIAETCRFIFANGPGVLAALWLPVTLAAVVLLIAFKIYFTMLARYLSAPDAGIASLALSAAVASYFVWLLLNVVGAARLARLVQGETPRGWFDARSMRSAARLYTAVLRYQLVVVVVAFGVVWAMFFVSHGLSARPAILLGWLGVGVIAAFFVVFSVRCRLLVPALALHERHSILRRGWQLSRGAFWPLAVIWAVATAVPIVVLQACDEFLTRPLVDGGAASGTAWLAAGAAELASNGVAVAAIVITLTLSSTLFFVLSTVASCLAYRALNRT